MIRKYFMATHTGGGPPPAKRSNEIQRIETFSDGVFAFAVTLLIVSLEVPHTFSELITTMRGFFGFGISFFLLVAIWQEQHRFFRLYGMDDSWILKLNIALLFLVLFYVYPLKFLFSLAFGEVIYGTGKSPFTITAEQFPNLMAIYAVGFVAIYFLFFLMYRRAWKKSDGLEMTPLQKIQLRLYDVPDSDHGSNRHLFPADCAVFDQRLFRGAGYVYFLIWPAINIFYRFRNKQKKKLFH